MGMSLRALSPVQWTLFFRQGLQPSAKMEKLFCQIATKFLTPLPLRNNDPKQQIGNEPGQAAGHEQNQEEQAEPKAADAVECS
jgi:hypothetical protein